MDDFIFSLNDVSIGGVSGAIGAYVFLLISNRLEKKRRQQEKNADAEEFDERQKLLQLQCGNISLSVFTISYFVTWLLKSGGFNWFGSSFVDFLFPLFCTAFFSLAYATWNDIDYSLKVKESAKKRNNIILVFVACLFFVGAAIFVFEKPVMSMAVIMIMLGLLCLISPVVFVVRTIYDRKKDDLMEDTAVKSIVEEK